jgi:hypothetical protein
MVVVAAAGLLCGSVALALPARAPGSLAVLAALFGMVTANALWRD